MQRDEGHRVGFREKTRFAQLTIWMQAIAITHRVFKHGGIGEGRDVDAGFVKTYTHTWGKKIIQKYKMISSLAGYFVHSRWFTCFKCTAHDID